MKKILFLVTALLAMVQQSSAETTPVITVANVEAEPGETITFRLNLSGGKVNQYTALQFDVQFPATGFSTTGEYTVNSIWTGVSATIGSVDATGLATIPFASADAIPSGNVENLVAIKFAVDSEVEVGEYDVTLKNIFLGYGTNDRDTPANVTFKVKVLENRTIKFDESNSYLPDYTAGVSKNVYMKRTIKANEWSTIILPFTLSKTKAEAAFGSDVQLAEFTGFEVDYGDATEHFIPLGIIINLSPYTMTTTRGMTGGKPFLIKTSSNIESFEAQSVKLTDIVNDANEEDDNGTPGKLTGTFVKTKIPENGLFISENKFWYSTGQTNVKAFRCWFELDAVLGVEMEFDTSRISMSFDDETTGIGYNKRETTNNNQWYTLDGRKLDKKPTAKGVYVKEGRKVVIK